VTHRPFTRSAEVYDVIYGDEVFDYPGNAAAVERLIRERRPDAVTLLEVGCGTGRYLAEFSPRFTVTGVDVSSEMLAIARSRFPEVLLVEGDMRSFDLGTTFDAVVCLFSSIGYMTTVDDLRQAVANMARHVSPGGVLVVDGWLRPEEAIDGHVSAGARTEGGLAVARLAFARVVGNRTEMEMHHLVGREGEGVEQFVERHVMLLASDQDHVAAMEAAGLTDVAVVGGYPMRSRFVATKP
jgi:SAM-dependent methyltransferase